MYYTMYYIMRKDTAAAGCSTTVRDGAIEIGALAVASPISECGCEIGEVASSISVQ